MEILLLLLNTRWRCLEIFWVPSGDGADGTFWVSYPEGTQNISRQRHLVFKGNNKISKNANNFWINWNIEMRLVLLDSLGHAENIDTKFSLFGRTSCPPSWFSVKTYFFELLLDRLSDFHQNRIVSSPDRAD